MAVHQGAWLLFPVRHWLSVIHLPTSKGLVINNCKYYIHAIWMNLYCQENTLHLVGGGGKGLYTICCLTSHEVICTTYSFSMLFREDWGKKAVLTTEPSCNAFTEMSVYSFGSCHRRGFWCLAWTFVVQGVLSTCAREHAMVAHQVGSTADLYPLCTPHMQVQVMPQVSEQGKN